MHRINSAGEGVQILKKVKYREYNFNQKYEKQTYVNIGLDYCPTGIFKIASWVRIMKNKGEKQYKICNTYSQWEKYVQSKLPTEILNYEDFVHWLIN